MFLIFRHGFPTLEEIPPEPSGEWQVCFECPNLFRVPQNTTCYVRLNMNLPEVKLSFDLQPHSSASGIAPSGIHSVVGSKVTAVYLSIKQYVMCNKMPYDDKGRHRLRMMVIIRENPLLFAV